MLAVAPIVGSRWFWTKRVDGAVLQKRPWSVFPHQKPKLFFKHRSPPRTSDRLSRPSKFPFQAPGGPPRFSPSPNSTLLLIFLGCERGGVFGFAEPTFALSLPSLVRATLLRTSLTRVLVPNKEISGSSASLIHTKRQGTTPQNHTTATQHGVGACLSVVVLGYHGHS